MDEGLRRQVDAQIGRVYERFVGHVSQGRGMTFEEVDGIGRGRVWIGSDAASINLVDQIGTLKDAAESAAGLAGLEEGDYSVERIKRKRPFFTGPERILPVAAGEAQAKAGHGFRAGPVHGRGPSRRERY